MLPYVLPDKPPYALPSILPLTKADKMFWRWLAMIVCSAGAEPYWLKGIMHPDIGTGGLCISIDVDEKTFFLIGMS